VRRRFVIAFALTISSALVLSSAISAQTQSAVAPSPLPSDSELDALVTARNWDQLGSTLSRPGPTSEFARKLNWLQTRIDNGGGFFLAFIYSRNFWTVGNSWIVGNNMKIDDPAKDPRVTAGLFSLYAFELIIIDGARCEDRSAPDSRISQFLTNQAATLEFLKQQSPDLKVKMVDKAIALERKTAPLRKDDDLICRYGLEGMRAGLATGAQKETPNTTGHFGKTIAVTPPKDWSPKFVSPDVYGPMQDKARASMRDNLLKLVGLS
jgi:hypothetical protein